MRGQVAVAAIVAVIGLVVVVAVGPAGPSRAASSAQASWVVTSLDAGTDWEATGATAINERSQIIGSGGIHYASHASMDWHGFVRQSNGKMVDLTLFNTPKGDTTSAAAAINDHGQVVGWSQTKNGSQHAFLWQNGQIHDLGTLAGTSWSEATAINERGQIAGNSYTSASSRPASRAFVSQDGKLIDLGTLGGNASMAVAINDHGQVVGWSNTKSGTRHAFLWQNGQMRDLGTLPGERGSTAVAINERGQIVGYAFAKLPDEHAAGVDQAISQLPRAFLWDHGKMIALAPGAQFSEAVAINDRGQIVGNSLAPNRSTRGFTWLSGHTTYLPTPAGATSHASAINDRGQIVGSFSPEGPGGLDHAGLWENGKLSDLGGVRFCSGEDPHAGATAINEHEQIVGTCAAMMDFNHALLWKLQ